MKELVLQTLCWVDVNEYYTIKEIFLKGMEAPIGPKLFP